MKKNFYGFDFGTSNCSLALNEDGKVEVLPIEVNDKKTIASILYFPTTKRDHYIGHEAVQEYLRHKMHGRFMQSLKSLLSDESFDGTFISGSSWRTLEQLIALIMSEVRRRADRICGQEINTVVLGRPARFSPDPAIDKLAEERLIAAAHRSGFKEVFLQLEPIAAAFHYESLISSDEVVLVADFGGGTTDFTVMKLSPSRRGLPDRTSDILASGGVYIGGDKFDSMIMKDRVIKHFGSESLYKFRDTASSDIQMMAMPQYLINHLMEWQHHVLLKSKKNQILLHRISESSNDLLAIKRLQFLIDNNLGYALFQEIEKAKCELSDNDQSSISFSQSVINIEEKISRSEFNRLIQPAIEQFSLCIDNVLHAAGIMPDQLDSVFVTGGSSLIPRLPDFLSQRFGKSKMRYSDTFTSVASGLAMSSYLVK